MNQQRIILIAVIVVSASITLLVNQVFAEKSSWFDGRDFWKMLDSQENYWGKYYSGETEGFELTVKVTSYENKNPKFVISTNGEKETLKLDKDGKGKVRFFIEDVESNKVTIKVQGKPYELTKKFDSDGYKDTVEFFFKR